MEPIQPPGPFAGLFGTPVPMPETDEFGIPYRRDTILTPETPEQWKARTDATIHVVARVFNAAILHLGEDLARHLWATVAKKKRGPRKGSRKPKADETLLRFYDDMVRAHSGKAPKWLIRRLAEFFYNEKGTEYGASASAVEMRVRRLLRVRERERERERKLYAAALMQPGVGLLSGLTKGSGHPDK